MSRCLLIILLAIFPSLIFAEPPSSEIKKEEPIKLSVSAEKNQEDPKLAETVATILKENFELRQRASSAMDEATASYKNEMLGFLNSRFNGTDVKVASSGVFIVVSMPEAVYKIGSTAMPHGIREKLRTIAEATIRYGGQFDLYVEGHTDNIPVYNGSKKKNNWTVGFERAENIATELQRMQVPEKTLAIVSRAAGVTPGKNEASMEQRRVEMLFAPKRIQTLSSPAFDKDVNISQSPNVKKEEPKIELGIATKETTKIDFDGKIISDLNKVSSETAPAPKLPSLPEDNAIKGKENSIGPVPPSEQVTSSVTKEISKKEESKLIVNQDKQTEEVEIPLPVSKN